MKGFEAIEALVRREPKLREAWKNIIAREDQKDILERAVTSDEPTQILLNGPPASAKSLLITEACDQLKGWKYLDASTLSGRGFIEKLDMNRNAKVICLDEIDKLNRKDQACLYNFLDEHRRVLYQTKDYKVDFRMEKVKVIATCNSMDKLNKPLRSRWLRLTVPAYSDVEFIEIAKALFKDKGYPEEIAVVVAKVIWDELQSRDVRMIRHIRALVKDKDTPEAITKFVKQIIAMQSNTQTEYNY